MKKYSLYLMLLGILAMNTSFRIPYRFDLKNPDKNIFTVVIEQFYFFRHRKFESEKREKRK